MAKLGVIMDTEKGQPLGVAPLGEDGIVPEENLPGTITEIKTDTEALLGDAQQLQTDLAEAKEDLEAAKTDLATVKADTTAAKTDLATAKTDLAAVKTTTDTVKTELAGARTDITAVKTDLGIVKTDVAAAKTDLATVKTDVVAAKTDLATVKTDLATVKTDLATVKTGVQELMAERPKRYGFKRSASDSNPATRITYLYDAVGLTPAKMGAESFEYGDWGDIWFVKGNYPCMLKPDGTEAYKLDPDDYAKRADTGAESDITKTDGDLNAMAAFPTIWIKRYMEGKDECVVFCAQQYDSSYHAYAHTDKDGTVKPVCYHAIFEGFQDEGQKLRSLSGVHPWNTTGGFDKERTAAQKNGTDWEIRTWSFNTMVADMCTLIAKSDNSQACFGQGHTQGGSKAEDLMDTGSLNVKGQFWGDTAGTASAMKVFHMENYWGDRWDRLAGLIQYGGSYHVKMTPEDGGYNATGAGYTTFPAGLGVVTAQAAGWQHETYTSDLGTLPVGVANGTDHTYTCDNLWWNTGITAIALAGGNCNLGACCGARCVTVNGDAGWSSWDIGASLFYV